jgi:hypothetical protein
MVYLRSVLAGLLGVVVYVAGWVAWVWFVKVRPYVRQSAGLGAVAGGFANGPWFTFSVWAFVLGAGLFFVMGYWWMFRAGSRNGGFRGGR